MLADMEGVDSTGWSRRAAIAGGAATLLGGCARTRDARHLSLWAMDVEGENAKYLLPAFTRATGISVEPQALPWTAAHEKLLTAYAGGSMPDVFMAPRGWLGELAMLRAVQPLPAAHGDLLDGAIAGHDTGVGGRSVAVPWTIDLSVQYYRRDLLARAGYPAPPLDLDAWKAMLRGVKRVQGDGYAVLMQLDWPDHLYNIAEQLGGPTLRDRETRGNFRSPGQRAALAFYKSIFDERLAPMVSSIEATDPTGDLARGWIALYPSGAWNRAELLRQLPRLPRDCWATTPMPGRGGQARALVASNVLCVSATAADPERAWALVRHLTAPATELRLHRVAGTLPSRSATWATPVMADDPVMRTFRQALGRSTFPAGVLEWDRISRQVQLVAEQMVRGQMSVDAAAVEMDRRIDDILAKRRWLLDRGRIA